MKFNSRLVIPVYRFWIRVTQVRTLSPRHARPVTFYRARSHIVRVDAQRSAAHRCAVAVAHGCTTCETDGILDARDERLLYFRLPLESASNSIILASKRNLGSFVLEYIRAMKLRIYSSSTSDTNGGFSFSSTINRKQLSRTHECALHKEDKLKLLQRAEINE